MVEGIRIRDEEHPGVGKGNSPTIEALLEGCGSSEGGALLAIGTNGRWEWKHPRRVD